MGGAAHAVDISVSDDRGRQVTLAAPAQRIVALAPFLTELVFAAGAGDRLVGVARFSDYPPQAAHIARVGDAARIDLERVLSLAPDLVVAWKSGNQTADVERLERLGVKVLVVEPVTFDAISRLLREFGTLAAAEAGAQRAAQAFDNGVAALRQRYGARPKVRVFYEIWHDPLMTVNGRHLISDVIRLCGGSNVFAGVPTLTPVVQLESVIALQPEVVLGGSSATTAGEFARAWRSYQHFAKLRNVEAMYVNPDLIQRQTPRILEGARVICDHLETVRSARRTR